MRKVKHYFVTILVFSCKFLLSYNNKELHFTCKQKFIIHV